MQIPTRQIAYLQRFVSQGVYEPAAPGIPFRVYGWTTMSSRDGVDLDNTPVTRTELYVPAELRNADTDALLDPIGANDRICLPEPGPYEGGGGGVNTTEVQRVMIVGDPYEAHFKLGFGGVYTTDMVWPGTSATTVGTRLNALSTIIAIGGVTVTSPGSGIWDVAFTGDPGVDQPLLTVTYTPGEWFTGESVSVTETTKGATEPAGPPVPTLIYPTYYIMGYPQYANTGLTDWRAGATLLLQRT